MLEIYDYDFKFLNILVNEFLSYGSPTIKITIFKQRKNF